MADGSVRLVKELKGAPLSVLMALAFAGGSPVRQDWLTRNTGYTDKPVRQALAYLYEHGFITQAGVGWVLGERAGGLALAPVVVAGEPAPDPQADAGAAQTGGEAAPNSDSTGPSRKNSDSPINIINKEFKDSLESINNNNRERKNSDSAGESTVDSDHLAQIQGRFAGRPVGGSSGTARFAEDPALGQALLELGIHENQRTRRLIGRITTRDVRAAAARIRDDPYHDLNETGLMVTILEGMADRNERRGGYESWNQ